MFYELIPLRQFRAGTTANSGILTYSAPIASSSAQETLTPGHIVKIPLGRSHTVGIITKSTSKKPDFPTKPITSVLYPTPLPYHLVQAIFWLSDYYFSPLPSVANLILPPGITKSRRTRSQPPAPDPQLPIIDLNPAQKQALKALQEVPGATKLFHGVTGSGKTNIYLTLALDAFRQQKSTILLVPEIALTSQLVQIFEKTFGSSVTLIHSRQTESVRHQIWENLLNTPVSQPRIIIGPRSALFAPIHNLGLIIIDEAHESTFYQDTAPRYSALRLASYITSMLNQKGQTKPRSAQTIFGTATPLISDYYLASKQNSLVTLTVKAKTTAITPTLKIINLRDRDQFTKNRYFSNSLLAQISQNLKNHYQTLIFHNRRGSAPLTICADCGWQALCPTCFLPLTLHTDTYNLLCHACGYTTQVPHSCPSCGHLEVIHKGFGTKLLATELQSLFPHAKIARFDADNAKNDTLDAKYDAVKTGEIDLIVGTQTVTKGLDLPRLASVGVVQADAGLALPDYAAEERTFHLLTQVIGRVGRGHIPEASCFIQTYQPDHPVINYACRANYPSFYHYLLKKRHTQHFPPFVYLAKISITYKTEATTLKHIQTLHRGFMKESSNIAAATPRIFISAPTPSFHEHTARGYTWQLILRAKSRTALTNLLKSVPLPKNSHITLDPPSLL